MTATQWASSSSGRRKAGAPPSRSRTRCTPRTGSSPPWPRCPHYQRLPVYQAAQDVQHSADGSAYGQYATLGAQLAGAFAGTQPHALWCYYAGPPGKAKLTAAAKGLAGTFGALHVSRLGDPAMVVRVRRAAAGWAVAAWLITHADSYGITDVRYRGYEWLRGHGTGKWVPGPAAARTPAGPDAVVFG